MLNVKDFGAVGDGAADDTAAILAAIAATPPRGDIVWLPAGSYLVSNTLLLDKPATLLGDGHGINANSVTNAPYLSPTEILWGGPPTGTAIKLGYGPDGRPVAGQRLEGFSVNLGAGCAVAIEMEGTQRSTVRNVAARNPSGGTIECVGLYMHAKPGETAPNTNCQHNLIEGFYAAVVSRVLVLDGNDLFTSNACHNTFIGLAGVFGLGGGSLDGLDLRDCDNNRFLGAFLFRQPGSTGHGIRFGQRARCNYLYHLQASLGGTYCEAPSNPGDSNVIFGYDRGNNEPAPVVETGAKLSWTEDSSHSTGWHLSSSLFIGGASISRLLSASTAYDPPNILKGAQATTTISAPGAALGDHVIPSFSASLQGLTMTGYVSAADVVTVAFFNGTAGSVNLPSATLAALILRR